MNQTPKSEPRSILVLNHNMKEHGTYFRAWKVAQILHARGWRVTFMTTGPGRYRPRRGERDGIEVWETPNWTFLYSPDEGTSPIGVLWRLWAAATRRWDVVYCFSHRPVDQVPARLARALRGATWICDWCDLYGEDGILAMVRESRGPARSLRDRLRDLCDKFDGRMEESAARSCDLLTVISRFLDRRALSLGVPPHRIHPMVSGADLEHIQPLDKSECRKKLGIDAEKVTLGYIANYHPDERLLLDALRIVFRKRPECRMIVVGPGFYGGEEALTERGIADRIQQFGRVPFARIPEFIGAADIMLVPMTDTSFNRSRWPNKIGDHLAAGRPQVACNVGDVRALMQNNEVGLGCEPTPEDFARAIIELIDNPMQRERMGRKARTLAQTEFNWDVLIDRLLERLDRLTSRKSVADR